MIFPNLQILSNLSVILSIDDSNLFYSNRDRNVLLLTLNDELRQITNWIKSNKLIDFEEKN